MLHPFEYDPKISAYHGVLRKPFNFMRHPVAPAGSKVLTWDSPDTRGSWADHGTEGIYMGPALKHFRAFISYLGPCEFSHANIRISLVDVPVFPPG